ncbi:MAG: 23S rRNA (guanosine(2251)-2'-O)-methyltransferase RlmB [Rickettsiales bacterium]|jgi:23S rRNA (guanosine2251-2'-O)-methyltransferase|nr:23S rRNA (guanosine(2251)-2'-O)-methyltransferase RlmB [Rickettsiales bacterium]
MNVIYGKYPVLMALKNRAKSFITVYTTDTEYLREHVATQGISLDPSLIKQKSNAELSKILGDHSVSHQGYVAQLEENKKICLQDFIDEKCRDISSLPKLLILDELTDPHNVGAILRTAVAFGVGHVIKTKHNSPGDLSVIAKTSAGTSEFVNLVEVVNINRTIEILKKLGYYVVGLCGRSEKSLINIKNMINLCLVIGSEGRGLRRLVRENCNTLCAVRMKNTAVESLNASVAAALAIYELWG